MENGIGYIAVFFCVLFWGSYLVPAKRFPHCSPWYFQWLVSLGAVLSSVPILFFRGWTFSWLGLSSGVVWSIGSILSLAAVQKSGLALSASAWVGTGIITSCLSGMAVSGETFGSPVLGILGLTLLTGFLILIARLNANTESTVRIRIHPAAPLTGIVFGAYMVPLKPSGLDGIDFIPSMALGILLAGIALKLIVRPKVTPEARRWGIFSGVLWNGGNLLGLVAVKALGLMIAYPLIQSALFIAILWGVVLYGELPGRAKRIRLFVYAAGLVTGAILIGFAG